MASLVVEGLTKTFREKKRVVEAVKNVSFSVGEGEMVGLLGPNGAGKTTTIKCTLGLVKPDSGRIEVEGVDAWRERRKSAAKFGRRPGRGPEYILATHGLGEHRVLRGDPRDTGVPRG